MRRTDNRLAVFDILFEFRQEVRARIPEAVQRIWPLPIEYSDLVLEDLKWTLYFPNMIPVVVIMRRDSDDHSSRLRSLEQAPEIGNDVVLGHTLSDNWPCLTVRAHEVDLRIDDNQGRPGGV